MLYGISPSLLPQPTDWPNNAWMCGQWITRCAMGSAPGAEIFLSAGDPPIYIGFGSMTGFDPHALLIAVIAAVDGRRALFYPGWSGADPLKLPTNFSIIGDTPHDWLFPRMSLVIHHGGSGTTHSAARAGRTFSRAALRSRSVLLGAAVTPAEASRRLPGASVTLRPPPSLLRSLPLERQPCGSRLRPSAKGCGQKTAWPRLSSELMF